VAIDRGEEPARAEYLVRRLTEHSGEGFAVLDAQGKVLLPGPSVLGYRAEDFVGRSAFELAHPDDRPRLLEALQWILANPEASRQVEYRARHAGGSWRWLEVVGRNLLHDPVVAGIVVNFRDVTARRIAERRMAAQYAVTHILAESSGMQDIVPRVLAALGETLGYGYGAFWTADRRLGLIRRLESWRAAATPEPLNIERACEFKWSGGRGLLGTVWAFAKPIWIPDLQRVEFTRAPLARADGLQSALLFPILEGSEVMGVVEFFSGETRPSDPDLLRTMEVAAGQIGQFLERRSLEEQLRFAQKLESLGVLAGGIAHDFNNLLTGIMGNISLAVETLPPQHVSRDYLKDALEGTEGAASLTRQLLAYAGKGKFVVERVDLSALARGMRALVERSIPKNAGLAFDLAQDLPAVEGDPSQLQQVILNLILNGAEAIPERSHGAVTIRTGRQQADADYLRGALGGPPGPGEYVYFEVRDTGTGMEPQVLARIFDPFFTTKFTGRGLGLAAVLGIVRGHRGFLKVESLPGQGSEFRVLFPAAGKPLCASEEETFVQPVPAAGATDRGTILVVDDEDLVRRTAAHTLEHYGYRVLSVSDGIEAVERFAAQPDAIDLVLLDHTMPGMSGEETLRELQRIHPQVKVLLSSGYNEDEATQRFAGHNLAGFLQKPYVASYLADAVRAVLAVK